MKTGGRVAFYELATCLIGAIFNLVAFCIPQSTAASDRSINQQTPPEVNQELPSVALQAQEALVTLEGIVLVDDRAVETAMRVRVIPSYEPGHDLDLQENHLGVFHLMDVPTKFLTSDPLLRIKLDGYQPIDWRPEKPVDYSSRFDVKLSLKGEGKHKLEVANVRNIMGEVEVDGKPWDAGGSIVSLTISIPRPECDISKDNKGTFMLKDVPLDLDEKRFPVHTKVEVSLQGYSPQLAKIEFIGTPTTPPEPLMGRVRVTLPAIEPQNQKPVANGPVLQVPKSTNVEHINGNWIGNGTHARGQVHSIELLDVKVNGITVNGRIVVDKNESVFAGELLARVPDNAEEKSNWENALKSRNAPPEQDLLLKIVVGKKLRGATYPRGTLHLSVSDGTMQGAWTGYFTGGLDVLLSKE